MNAADVLTLLDILYEVKVGLHPDGKRLDVRGPPKVLPLLVPMLTLHKPELLAFLRQTTTTNEVAP
jgi:hypothetical protein